MPSKSKAQYKLMQIAAYNADFAKKRGLDQAIAREFHAEDKKKEKEDPEWFKNLPEKADTDKAPDKRDKTYRKKGKKGKGRKKAKVESSTEAKGSEKAGFLYFLSTLFSNSEDQDANEGDFDAFDRLAKNPDMLGDSELRTGPVSVSGINNLLLLKSFGTNWLSGVENTVHEINAFAEKFIKARGAYDMALKKIYEQCEKLQPAEALKYAREKVKIEKDKLDKITPPSFTASVLTAVKQSPHGYKFEAKNPGASPSTIQALTVGEVKKCLSLISQAFEVDVWSYDEDQDYWTLDDTDEAKWWNHHFPDDDHIWGPMLGLFPVAGDHLEFEYEDDLNDALKKIREGLKRLITASVK